MLAAAVVVEAAAAGAAAGAAVAPAGRIVAGVRRAGEDRQRVSPSDGMDSDLRQDFE